MTAEPGGRRLFAVPSAGRILHVDAPGRLADWWPQLAPHLPGVHPDNVLLESGSALAELVLPGAAGPGDVRRLINAHLHLLHLEHATLCLHAVALHHGRYGGAALLLGGHGAGKTLVAVALAARGWGVLAGDVALLDASERGVLAVRGGTSAFLARRGPVRRWFPELALEASGPDRVDLRTRWSPLDLDPAAEPAALVAALVVDIDGDPHAGAGVVEKIDRHAAATVLLRASGHLLDRILDDGDTVLRQVEEGPAARQRVARVRAVADRVPVHAAWGAPRVIAAHVERLAATARRRGQVQAS